MTFQSDNIIWRDCYLSLGGNIGDAAVTIEDALARLSNMPGIEVVTRSRFFETPPWGKTDQAAFINICAHIRTSLDPQRLLADCLELEKAMGRERKEKWGPRTIDIDILTYGDQKISEPDLIVPHPYMMERAFVLIPLRDIAPNFKLGDQTLDASLASLDQTGILPLEPVAV